MLNKTWTWTYDAAGNILSRKEYAYTTGTLGTPTDTVSYGYATSGWKDLLTSYDGFSYSYDTIGNPVYDGIWTYTWEHGRELESQYRIIALPDGRQMDVGISYVYDVNGMRTQKSILTRWFAGTTSAPVEYMTDEQYDYVYNGSSLSQLKVTKETTAGNGSPTTTTENLNFTYDASGTPMTVTHNGTTYYYVTNLQGDVTDILNSAGTAVVSYTYDAWGNIRSTNGTLSTTLGKYNPLRYRGYVYDTDTKFYYLQSRYYNPDVGRFINADVYASTGQGFEGNNMFAYCNNNPPVHTDYAGNFPSCLRYSFCVTHIFAPGSKSSALAQFQINAGAFGEYGQAVQEKYAEVKNYVINDDIEVTETRLVNDGFAFYKGVPVFRVNAMKKGALSFGAIFIGGEVIDSVYFENTLKHEYGHTVHFLQVGPVTYGITVGIPSLTFAAATTWGLFPRKLYYDLPWERIADELGDVNRGYLPASNTWGSIYWFFTLIVP